MRYTYIRHAEQISHKIRDPPIKPFDASVYDYKFDIIICSPYLRTRQTAQILNKNANKPLLIDARISEYLGPKKSHIITTLDPSSEEYGPIPSYGETWEQFTARIDAHYEYVRTLKKNVLIVTHGIVVKYLCQKIYGTCSYKRGHNVPFVRGFDVEYGKNGKMIKMSNKITDKDCQKWRKSPKINPKTGKRLYEKAGQYKKYLERCGSPSSSPTPSKSSPSKGSPSKSSKKTDCEKWRQNKLVNPKTGRSIQPKGNVYKALQKECEKDSSPSKKNISPFRSPKGKSPMEVIQPPSPEKKEKPHVEKSDPFTEEECKKWKENPTKNPRTGRKITKNGKLYKNLELACSPKYRKLKTPEPKTPEPKTSERKTPEPKTPEPKTPEPKTSERKTPEAKDESYLLFNAVRSRNLKEVKRLIEEEGVPVDTIIHEREHTTSLHSSVNEGYKPLINYLVKAGADVNALDTHQQTPLFYAPTSKKTSAEIVNILLKAGADPNHRDDRGWTYLHNAVSGGNLPVVIALLKGGADSTLRTTDGKNYSVEDIANTIPKWLPKEDIIRALQSHNSK